MLYLVHKLICFRNENDKAWSWPFNNCICGHFFANYISSFHKSEVLTVILKDPTCQNLCWIKSHNIKHNCFLFLLFSICKKKNGDIQLMNSHFLTIFGNFFGDYINIFQKIEIQNIILRCIVSQNLSWIKSYNII